MKDQRRLSIAVAHGETAHPPVVLNTLETSI